MQKILHRYQKGAPHPPPALAPPGRLADEAIMYIHSKASLLEEFRFAWQEKRAELIYQLCVIAVIAIVLGALLGL